MYERQEKFNLKESEKSQNLTPIPEFQSDTCYGDPDGVVDS